MESEASVRSFVKSFWFWSRRNVVERMGRSWIPRIGQFKKTKKKSECRTVVGRGLLTACGHYNLQLIGHQTGRLCMRASTV